MLGIAGSLAGATWWKNRRARIEAARAAARAEAEN
jgi:hypothetical protein